MVEHELVPNIRYSTEFQLFGQIIAYQIQGLSKIDIMQSKYWDAWEPFLTHWSLGDFN